MAAMCRPPPEHLAVIVIHDVEQAERASIPEAVVHEVEAPDLVRMPWFEEPLLDTCWKALLRAPTNVQLHGGVDPVDPLVIPAVTSPTQPRSEEHTSDPQSRG